ncbi:2'-5' RNA ligase family protein [Terrabacter sp. 2RAF25]|uniref:2'-5' RNA ligase family protein n=1 Tax=Terrabacter sp. 2RAF25 TaxID=3232998 RepID=UPI003F9C0D29
MTSDTSAESALLLAIPAAEPAVARHRERHDLSARMGVPAHVTVAYPFKPWALVEDGDLSALAALCRATPALDLMFSRTGWFGDDVLFLEPDDLGSIVALTRRVERAFPDYPIYGGVFDDLHPHLTVGHGSGVAALRAIEQELASQLPLSQVVDRLQLWSGPPLASATPGWRLMRSFPLGG